MSSGTISGHVSCCQFDGRPVKLIHLAFELNKAEISDRRMTPGRVLETLDVVEHICSCLVLGEIGLGEERLESLDQAGLFDPLDRSRPLRFQVEAWRPGRSQKSDQGHLPDAVEMRVSMRCRNVYHQRQVRLSSLQGLSLQSRSETPERRVKAKLSE